MKVAHISLLVNFLPGFANSINSEAKSGRIIGDNTWETYIVSADEKPNTIDEAVNWIRLWMPENFLGKTDVSNPFIFYFLRVITINFLLFRIIFNFKVNQLTKKHDFVFVRYNSADLLAWLFLKRKKQIIFVYHNRTYFELKLYSKIGAFIERITGRFQTIGCKYIAAVTDEIGKYQIELSPSIKKYIVKPNGIEVDLKKEFIDKRGGKLKFLMIASTFSDWQGLDILIDRNKKYTKSDEIEIHLVGKLSKKQEWEVEKIGNIIYHGVLNKEQIEKLYERIDVGIGTLAFFRSGLLEASPIKVREYLNNGILTAIGYDEFVFPKDFKYIYRLGKNWELKEIVKFVLENRNISRDEVRSASIKYISQKEILKKVIKQLGNCGND